MRPYLFRSGITELGYQLSGRERIYLGIRPYGFHVGNQVTLLAYPRLLCEELLHRGITPRFTFYVFLNDYEQFQLSGPDKEHYPFNVYPKHTTLQYTFAKNNPHQSVVELWAPIIEREIRIALKEYPQVSIQVIRNSELRSMFAFQDILLKTIANPDVIGSILRSQSKHSVDTASCVFVLGVCPECTWARGVPRIRDSKTLTLQCSHCGHEVTRNVGAFDYWFYHKPLALPRLKIFDIDLCITGVDHLDEGDFMSRRQLIEAFDPSIRMPEMLFAPKVLGADNEKLSKRRNNTYILPLHQVLSMARVCDEESVRIPLIENELRPIEPCVSQPF